MNKLTDKSGFTLIETMVAIVVLSIGVMALYAMQTTAIKGNAVAISLTTAANLGQDRIELVMAQPYTDALLQDGAGATNGCAGLDDRPGGGTGNTSDNSFVSPSYPNYTVYWNVANDCSLPNIPDASAAVDEQKPKHVRFFVVRSDLGIQKTISFNYIKQNTM